MFCTFLNFYSQASLISIDCHTLQAKNDNTPEYSWLWCFSIQKISTLSTQNALVPGYIKILFTISVLNISLSQRKLEMEMSADDFISRKKETCNFHENFEELFLQNVRGTWKKHGILRTCNICGFFIKF